MARPFKGHYINPQIFFYRGYASFQQNRLDDALASFKQVVDLEPTNKDAYYFMGLIHDRQGDSKASMKAYIDASRVDPGCADIYDAAREKEGGQADASSMPVRLRGMDYNFSEDKTRDRFPLIFYGHLPL